MKANQGFTLIEVLMAMVITGLLVAVSIPKIAAGNTPKKRLSNAKEAAAMITAAYEAYQKEHTPVETTSALDLIRYMNVSGKNSTYNSLGINCTNMGSMICYDLPNGSMLYFSNASKAFGGTNPNNAIGFSILADEASVLSYWLYFNGKVLTSGNALVGTVSDGNTYNPVADPSWYTPN